MDIKNIFISYGHAKNEKDTSLAKYDGVIKNIAEDLRKHSYNVFIDVDYLHGGNEDWEKTIDNHIRDSKYFLYFISEISNSPERYCQNELCRAGEIGSCIIPIKLDNSYTPLSINKYQRLDLEKCIDPEGQLIEFKYDDFLKDLLNIISNKNRLSFSNDDIRLKNDLKPISSHEDLFRYYTNFCGREKAFKIFEDFLNSNDNFLWFYARPGFGKTTFSSMLCWKYPESIGAIHFCKFNNSDRTNSKKIFTSIAYDLSEFIQDYKSKLTNLLDLDSIFEKSASRIFEYLIIDQLHDINPTRPVVIIIDALDECSWRGENEVCEILERAYRKNEIPNWLKFVVTSRDQADIRRYLNSAMQSNALETTSNEDLIKYFKMQLDGFDINEKIISHLLHKSEGCFLYAFLICKNIKDDKINLENIEDFPLGITGFWRDCFDRIFGASCEAFDEVKPILEILCITPKSINEDFLCELLRYEKDQTRNILRKLGGLFQISSKCIEPLHKSVIDWLTDDSDYTHTYYINKKKGYKRLYAFLKEKYKNREYLSNKNVLETFGNILIELDNKDELFDLLNDYDFQMTKIKYLFFDSGLESYIQEITYLYDPNDNDRCLRLFKGRVFKTIFSNNRRILYNSGLFFNLKEIGLNVSLRNDEEWDLEGEIGKIFYYYIIENFDRVISKANILITKNEEIKKQQALLAEVLNVKGLSERKIVDFDNALKSFEAAIENATIAINENYVGESDPLFEKSLSYLIKGKIYTNMSDFHRANKCYKEAIKCLHEDIDDMGNCDRKISNMLFLAEDYRVFADSLIWEDRIDEADKKLEKCKYIYEINKETMDRYFIRYKYTTQLSLAMSNDPISAISNLKTLLKNKIKGKYDNGQIHMILGLAILLSKESDLYKEGLTHAEKACEIFESINAPMETNMSYLIIKKLNNINGNKKVIDFDFENEYIKNWINYVEKLIDKKLENNNA